jgi:hypothetical protein
MRNWFFNSQRGLRNGWWALVFIVGLVVAGFLQVGVNWMCKWLGVPGGVWMHSLGTFAVLGATWAMLRLRHEAWASVGFDMKRSWARQFAWGAAIGIGQILLAVLMLWAIGGVRLELDPAGSLQTLGSGLLMFLLVAIKEETLFRGFLFQRLRDGIGLWPTQLLLALLFAGAHWMNPGMRGATLLSASLGIFVSSLVFGLAYVRSNSLALPIGIHLGWNWMQGHVMGFGVSGIQLHGWFKPMLLDKPDWLTGAAFGIEASVLGVAVDLLLLIGLLLWKGSSDAVADSMPSADLQTQRTH